MLLMIRSRPILLLLKDLDASLFNKQKVNEHSISGKEANKAPAKTLATPLTKHWHQVKPDEGERKVLMQ